MDPGERLEPRHLIGREHYLARPQWLAFPAALIQFEDRGGLLQQAGIAGKEPLLKEPGPQGVLVEAAPDGTIGELQAEVPGPLTDIEDREARQRTPLGVRRALTRQGLHQEGVLRGGKPAADQTVG